MYAAMVTVTMAIAYALFALFVTATTFSLGLRAYETERLVVELRAWDARRGGGAAGRRGRCSVCSASARWCWMPSRSSSW